jgi:hypothetical protein
MSRVLLFVLGIMQAQVMVTLAIAPTMICPERCDDDAASGHCSPACLSCSSSTHTAAPVVASAPVTPTLLREPVRSATSTRPGDPDPGDIFHVPKRLLA